MRRKVIKKEKLKKITKKLIIYCMISQFLFTATSCGFKKSKSNPIINNTTIETTVESSSDKPIACNKREYDESSNIYVKAGEIGDSLINVNSLNISYPYEELFNESNSVNKFVGDKNINVAHNEGVISGNQISASLLYQKVLENNKNYSNKTLKKELSNSVIKQLCDYVAEAINNEIALGKIKDLSEVSCVLSDLKMFEVNSMNEALINSDRCLLITPDMINNTAKKYSDLDYMKLVVQHEAIHLCQISCTHVDNSLDHKYGFAEFRNDNEVNMYEYLWLSEANASIESAKFQNSDPISYKSYVKYLNLIDFSNQLNNNSYNSLNDIVFSRNINDLYNYFQVSSDLEKREVDKFMFSLDIVLNNNTKYFNEFSKRNTGVSQSELKQQMKVSISEFLTKNFYKSILKQINSNGMELNDIFYLINLFEANINDVIYYSSESDYDNNKEFFDIYLNIQDELFMVLSNKMGITFDEVVEKFSNYSLYKEDRKTVNSSFNFGDNYNKIVNKLHNNSTYFTGNIRDYSLFYKKNNYVK